MSQERTFLHDISSPVTALRLNLENVIAILQENKNEQTAECLSMLDSSMRQVDKVVQLISTRKALLVGESKK